MKKNILLTSLLTFVAILTASAQSWTNGLTSYYPFDGNANDAVGGDNGTATNVVLVADRFGNPNSAYRFNGTNSAVDVAPVTLNNLTSGTLSTWIELDRNSAEALFAKQVDGANSFGVFTVGIYSDVNGGQDFGDAGRLYFRSRNGGPLASSSTLLSTGAWHQVTVTFTTTNCNLYIDGVPSGSASGDFSIPDYLTPTTTSIGSWELDLPSSLYVTLAEPSMTSAFLIKL